MKIGDRIFVRGYVDEIRKDTVIVRNDGGYFGTVLSEVTGELPSAQQEEAIPVSWIEAMIERFMMTGDAFSGLTASIIRVMLNEWKKEQEGGTK